MKIAVNNRKKKISALSISLPLAFRSPPEILLFDFIFFFSFVAFYLAVSNDNNNNVTILSLGHSPRVIHEAARFVMPHAFVYTVLSIHSSLKTCDEFAWNLEKIYFRNSHHHISFHRAPPVGFCVLGFCVQLMRAHNIAWILYGRGYNAHKQCILSTRQRQLPSATTAGVAFHFAAIPIPNRMQYMHSAHQIWLPQSFVHNVVQHTWHRHIHISPVVVCVFFFVTFFLIVTMAIAVSAIDVVAWWWRWWYFGGCNYFFLREYCIYIL